jgi:hypothetical protein
MTRDETRNRLQLYIKRSFIKKARKRKLNLSKLAEEWFNAYLLIGDNSGDLHKGYSELVELIVPLLREYDCMINIAIGEEMLPNEDDNGNAYEVPRELNIFLMPDGSFYINEQDRYFEDISKIAPGNFLDPEQILSNLVEALAQNKKAMKKKMKEILMAKSIVYAISKSLHDEVTIEGEKESSDAILKSKKYRRKSSAQHKQK